MLNQFGFSPPVGAERVSSTPTLAALLAHGATLLSRVTLHPDDWTDLQKQAASGPVPLGAAVPVTLDPRLLRGQVRLSYRDGSEALVSLR